MDEAQNISEEGISAQQQQISNGDTCAGAGNHKEKTVSKTKEVSLILINGGMDAEGEIFDDTLVVLL